MNDEDYMRMALSLAEQGRGWTSPNPMVGAVIVKDGSVVGRGFHAKAGMPHAEVNALEDAGEKAQGATLYVTLEPCNHTGRTPPCTAAILQNRIKRVVVGMRDPNPRVEGGGVDVLRRRGLDVATGVCEAESRRLNECFVKHITTGLPFVMLKCASTLDGRIATGTGDAKWITNVDSRSFVHQLRHAVDAILVGVGTVKADDPRLTTRLESGKGADPIRVILDARLSTPVDAKLLHISSASDTLIATNGPVDEGKRRRLEQAGAKVLVVEGSGDHVDLKPLLNTLGRMNVTSLLIEGGSHVNGSALRSGIVDKLYFFLAPKLCGGNDGVPVCSGVGVERMQDALQLRDVSVHRFGDDVMIEGYMRKA
jgi:diaminohydroxyphosphoribosylaminopyrimidine deaminase/5-amino-6-(5-phosphoribosylamino)uracil reductase